MRSLPVLFALSISFLGGCAPTALYLPAHSWSQVEDLDEAVRISATRDLPCSPANISVDRIEISGKRQLGHRPTFLDIAEGCGQRVTYTEQCDYDAVIPPGLTEEQAARKRAATLDPDRELTCRLRAIGRVSLEGAPPRGDIASGIR